MMRDLFHVKCAVAAILILLGAGVCPVRATDAQKTGAPATDALADIPVVRIWPDDPPATQPVAHADAGEKLVHHVRGENAYLALYDITHAWLSVFLPPHRNVPTAAVIICPGGGYRMEMISREGFDIARKLNDAGIAAFVLKYRLPHGQTPAPDALPMPQQDVLRAIQVVRARAAAWGIDPKRVGVMGFSAGGHLAGTAATMYNDAKDLPTHDAIAKESARPDFAVLIYPVISMEPHVGHAGSRNNLIGKNADEAVIKRFSVDQHVNADTPPLFISQARDDKTVPFHNSELIAAAAQKAGVHHEFIAFDKGGHGFGLENSDDNRQWFSKCIEWLKAEHFVESK